MLAGSFFIESSSMLLVTRTSIKARSSSILGRIRPVTCPWVMKITFEFEYLWSQSANLDQVLCVASLGWGKSCVRFWGRLDQNSGVDGNRKPPLRKMMSPPFLSCFFNPILFILAGNEDMHKISDEFEFWPDRTTDYWVSCPWGLKNFP